VTALKCTLKAKDMISTNAANHVIKADLPTKTIFCNECGKKEWCEKPISGSDFSKAVNDFRSLHLKCLEKAQNAT
jgi:hypothetical protein